MREKQQMAQLNALQLQSYVANALECVEFKLSEYEYTKQWSFREQWFCAAMVNGT